VFLAKMGISEAPKYIKTSFFRGSAPDPLESLQRSPYSIPSWWGEGSLPYPQESHPRCRPYWPRASALWALLDRVPLSMHITLTTDGALLTLFVEWRERTARCRRASRGRRKHCTARTHTHTHTPFYGPFSGTTRVSRCQKRTSGLYGAKED